MGGTTGWHFSITHHARHAPHVPNYSGAAAGRTFPSAAGFHTAELFFTDDSGVYLFPTRDAGALVDPAAERVTSELMVERHRGRVRKLADRRLYLPTEEPHPGSVLDRVCGGSSTRWRDWCLSSTASRDPNATVTGAVTCWAP
jgi:hypothetical protein